MIKRQSFRLVLFCLLLPVFSCHKNEPLPEAGFSYSGNNGFHAPCNVTFDNRSVNAYSYLWEFGDDSTSALKDVDHTYAKAGSYEVRLRSYTENGKEWASEKKLIIIKP